MEAASSALLSHRAGHWQYVIQTPASGARPAGRYDPDELLTERASAKFLKLTQRALQKRRARGLPPTYIKLGKSVRYRRRDLLAWIEANSHQPAPLAAERPRQAARASDLLGGVRADLAELLTPHGRELLHRAKSGAKRAA